ncbi:MAG: PKD domain-containing protein [Planctomycetes bacterium]|nr:PKD domain-containing protein [Planctomycetota bacterium]
MNKKRMYQWAMIAYFASFGVTSGQSSRAADMGTGFTYQGEFAQNGNPVNAAGNVKVDDKVVAEKVGIGTSIPSGLLQVASDAVGETISDSRGTAVRRFLTPDGRFDLEAARDTEYEGKLDFSGFQPYLDRETGEVLFAQSVQGCEGSCRTHPAGFWSPLEPPWAGGPDGVLMALAVFNGDLIVGGKFKRISGVDALLIARWDGSSWNALGPSLFPGLRGYNTASVEDLTVWNNSLVVAGEFRFAGALPTEVNNIAAWDGSTWSALGNAGTEGTNSRVYAVTVYQNDVIAGGAFTTAGGVSVSKIARYDGVQWYSLGSGMNLFGQVYALTTYEASGCAPELLIAGGQFTAAGGVPVHNVAYWDGVGWGSLSGPGGGDGVESNGVLELVDALLSYVDPLTCTPELIVAGEFTTANVGGATVVANRIAAWNGCTGVWHAVGTGFNRRVRALGSYDGLLIAGGEFTQPEGEHIARWDGCDWQPLNLGLNHLVLALTPWTDTALLQDVLIAAGYLTEAGGPGRVAPFSARWNQNLSNQPPFCDASGPYSGEAGQSVQFDGTDSTDSDGTIQEHYWWFSDFDPPITGATPTHTYTYPGLYEVTLCVQDNDQAVSCCLTSASIGSFPTGPPVMSNGGFSTGELEPWEFTSGFNPPRPEPGYVIEDMWPMNNALRISRDEDDDGSHAIARQMIDIFVEPEDSIGLSFDVRIDCHNFADYDFWNVYPANVEVEYKDESGDTYTFRRSFYTFVSPGHDPDQEPLAEEIPEGVWGHLTYDLSDLDPPIGEIVRIKAGARGWSYDVAFDNISLTVRQPPEPPLPGDILKNRYISIDPRGAGGLNFGLDLDIRITLNFTDVNGVTAEGSHWWANEPDEDCISIVGPTRPITPPNWDACPTLHLTGCPIIPTSTYDIVVFDGDLESEPLEAQTQARPSPKWHGDVVGFFDGETDSWTGPQGIVNIDDVVAAIKTFQDPGAFNATHVSVTDVHPNLSGAQINKTVNFDDVFVLVLGFQGFEYPGTEVELCPDP